MLQNLVVDRCRVHYCSALHDSEITRKVLGVPRVLPNLGDGYALERVDEQHPGDQVAGARGEVRGHVEDPALDLLKQVGDVLVVKRETPAQEGVKNHTTAPHVDLSKCHSKVKNKRGEEAKKEILKAVYSYFKILKPYACLPS